jgi:(2Fe-2S) ferredoxin
MGAGRAGTFSLLALLPHAWGSIPAKPLRGTVCVCTGKTCRKDGSRDVLRGLEQLAEEVGGFEAAECGCLGQCGKGPNLAVFAKGRDEPKRYSDVFKPSTTAAILEIQLGVEVPDALVELQKRARRGRRLMSQDKLDEAEREFADGLRDAGASGPIRAELEALIEQLRERRQ